MDVILQAAAHILDTQEAAAYTTNAIAERAGVSIGSLYQYFPNKNAITLALIDQDTTLLLARLQQAAAKTRGMDLLRHLAEVAAAWQLRRPRLAQRLDEHEATLPPHYRDAEVQAAVMPLLQRALAEILPARQANHPAMALDLIALTRALTDAAGARGETDPEALAQRILRTLRGYLAV